MNLFLISVPVTHGTSEANLWFLVPTAAAGDGEAVPPGLFHLRGLWKESGWNPVHCGRNQPNPLYWRFPQVSYM